MPINIKLLNGPRLHAPANPEITKAAHDGRKAALDGKSLADCPQKYRDVPILREAWMVGLQGQYVLARLEK